MAVLTDPLLPAPRHRDAAARPGAWTVIQENKADRWARWLLTVAGAIAAAGAAIPPSLHTKFQRQAAPHRGGKSNPPPP